MPINPIIIPSELTEKIVQGKCAVYVGAGLSMGAGLPDWKKLLKDMIVWSISHSIPLTEIDELNSLIDKDDLLDVADIIKASMGAARFREFMVSVFHKNNLKPTENHKLLPQIPFSQALTSNYDKLVESAYLIVNNGKPTPLFTHLDKPELGGALGSSDFHILKTHGDIDRIDSIVLTQNQYRDLMHNNGAYKRYLENIFTTKSVLFLGFSLTDPDLLTVLDALQVHLHGVTTQHFALMDATRINSLKAEQFRRNYNINVIGYTPSSDSHPEVTEFLKQVAEKTPKKHLRQLAELKNNLDDIDTHYKVIASTDGKFEIYEKFPGASEEKPLTHTFTLTSDKEITDALQRHFDTGEKLTINKQHIKGVTLPELFTKLFNINTIDTNEVTITIGPARNETIIKTRLILQPYDGENVVIENIELKNISAGKKQAIISNEHQDHLFKIKFTLDFTYKDAVHSFKADVSITLSSKEFNLRDQLLVDKYFYAASKGAKLIFENIETGKSITNPGYIKFDNPPDHPKWIPILEALLTIETAAQIQLSVPKKLSDDEVKFILNLAHIIKYGKGKADFKGTIDADTEKVQDMLEKEPNLEFSTYTEEQHTIEGKRFSLGLAWITANPVLSKEEKSRLREEVMNKPEQNKHLVHFATTPENQALTYHFNFLSPDDFEILHENPKYRDFAINHLINTLFEAATNENQEIDIDVLLSCFDSAAKQVNDYGKPYNMLPRANINELKSALEIHLPKLTNSQRGLFFSKLVELKLITDEDIIFFSKDLGYKA
jgi:hypothetical protein